MDQSLDDIIKKRYNGKKGGKAKGPNKNKGVLKKGKFKPKAPQKKPYQAVNKKPADARSKIILKQRSKISDARVILAKKQKRQLHTQNLPNRRQKASVQRARQRSIVLTDDDDDIISLAFNAPAPVLRRTVKNNYMQPPAPMPPLPTFSRTLSDPFDCYEPYERPSYIPTAPPPPELSPDDFYYAMDQSPRKGILRSSKEGSQPASAALKSRLFTRPDPHQPSGIFGRNTDPDKDNRESGYRIVVSNLHTTVTQSDIQELFEDIGELIDSRLVRPGIAEVIYRRQHDAELAVETYHNRQLDGQPMKCLLVRPRTASRPPATTAARVFDSKSMEVDMDTLHKVLFRR